MKFSVKSYSQQSSLISSIIFFIVGAILFTNAEKVMSIFYVIVGAILGIAAIISLFIFYRNKKKYNTFDGGNLALGIITLIFAIIFFFFSNIVEQSIRFLVGAWILFSGINRLITALKMNSKNDRFIPMLVISILIILVGFYTIVFGDVILSTIGVIMMVYAVIEISGYILYKKDEDTPEEKEEGETTLLIPEKEEEQEETKIDKKKKKKNKKVKDAQSEESDN
jgi:uncharacterized membrane protein HdeD (DUF308 family)